jgi:4'-phosphopantetheinyl transferase
MLTLVWTPLSPALAAAGLALLSDAERARHARFRVTGAADAYAIGRWLVRTRLGALLGVAPAAVPLAVDARGKPYVDGVASVGFSISHSRHVAAVLLGPHADIGLDVEGWGDVEDALALAPHAFGDVRAGALRRLPGALATPRFIRWWTRREALGKAAGCGLLSPIESAEVFDDAVLEDVPWPGGPKGPWWIREMAGIAGHAAAVAGRGGPEAVNIVRVH